MEPTSLEQSKKLLELGIDPNTADMHIIYQNYGDHGKFEIGLEYSAWDATHINGYYPAWSLEALLRYMSTGVDIKKHYDITLDKVVYVCGKLDYVGAYAFDEFPIMTTAMYENPVDAAFELTVWLLEHYTSKLKKK